MEATMGSKLSLVDAPSSSAATLTSNREPIPGSMMLTAILISLQSFQIGYAVSSLNSAIVTGDAHDPSRCYYHTDDASPSCPPGTIYRDLLLTTTQAQVATALTIAGAWVGCYCGSQPAERFGRRLVLLATNIFYVVGGIATAFGGDVEALYIGRLIIGIGVGISSLLVPILLSELASSETRGTVTGFHQVQLTLAIFFAGVIGYGLVSHVDHGWKFLQIFVIIPSIVMLSLSAFIPESPKWLVRQGKTQQARLVLKQLRHPDMNIEAEIKELQKASQTEDQSDAVTWSEVFRDKKAMMIGFGLNLAIPLSGINTVIFYSTTIFGFAGFNQSIVGTALVGTVNFLSTLVSVYLIDRVGRKTLLLVGLTIMIFSLLLMSFVLVLADSDESTQGGVAVFATLVYVIGFAIGLGSVVWVMLPEIVPTRIRTKAVGIFLSVNYAVNLAIGLLTLTAIDGLGGLRSDMTDDEVSKAEKNGVGYFYFIFAGTSFVTLVFVLYFVPETKGMNASSSFLNDRHASQSVDGIVMTVMTSEQVLI